MISTDSLLCIQSAVSRVHSRFACHQGRSQRPLHIESPVTALGGKR